MVVFPMSSSLFVFSMKTDRARMSSSSLTWHLGLRWKNGPSRAFSSLYSRISVPIYAPFSYFEDLFAQDAGEPTVVNVASKAYRAVRKELPSKSDCS